jgi:formylglycine-generating enzyme required for sulfatase activity
VIPVGTFKITWRIKTDDGDTSSLNVLRLRVTKNSGSTVLAERTVNRSSFTSTGTWFNFSVNFTNTSVGAMEFPVQYIDTHRACFWVDKVVVETVGCEDGATSSGSAGTSWVKICGGTFLMGSTDLPHTQLVHSVTVPDFEMLKTEVTVTQYKACVTASVCTVPLFEGDCSAASYGNWEAGRNGHPVNCVTWQQAIDFCAWIGGRLPSEAEWEYAARSGGQDIDYPWGDITATCTYAVMYEGGSGCNTGHTMAACSKTVGNTDQGLCDMAGNVWEWVQDVYHGSYNCDYYPGADNCGLGGVAPLDGSAWEGGGSSRVVRSGSLGGAAVHLRTAFRDYVELTDFHGGSGLGFRCAR